VGTSRIRPYLAGGAGAAHVRRTLLDDLLPHRFTLSSTVPMLTAGGGAAFPVGRDIAVDVDVCYQRVFEYEATRRFDEPELALVRIGCSLRYRF
jgi:hypothetical protein